jgi:hypothetical protein
MKALKIIALLTAIIFITQGDSYASRRSKASKSNKEKMEKKCRELQNAGYECKVVRSRDCPRGWSRKARETGFGKNYSACAKRGTPVWQAETSCWYSRRQWRNKWTVNASNDDKAEKEVLRRAYKKYPHAKGFKCSFWEHPKCIKFCQNIDKRR